VLSTLKWYVLVELSSNLYERVGALIMNAFFHLRGNTIFGVALNFTSYIRQTTQGVTFGLEAVSARLHATRRDTMPVLMRHSTRLHALAALPTGVLVAALAHPLIELWLRQEEARPLIPQIATTVQVLSLALTTRAISDGWMMILYGAGHIRRYAPLVFAGGVVCPALSAVLTPVMPEPLDLYTVAAMFSLVYTLAHFILLPRVAAKCLGLRYGEIFAPLFRPVIALLAALPVLIVAAASISTWTLLTTAVAAAAFGTAYVIAAYCIVLTREEKERFVLAPIRARIPRVNRR